jgi:hypothetical protein
MTPAMSACHFLADQFNRDIQAAKADGASLQKACVRAFGRR